jgi:galactokinase
MNPGRAEALLHRARTALGRSLGFALHVPGRIEVLGKHTDYCGGFSLVCAVDRGIVMACARRADSQLRVIDADRGAECSFAISPELRPTVGDWSNYPMTVARRLAGNFGPLCGLDVAICSDLPMAAGLSSSSALVTGIFLAIAKGNGLRERAAWTENLADDCAVASYCGCIENGRDHGSLAGDRGVGTFGGSQDHAAILMCRADELLQLGFGPLRRLGHVPMTPGHVFVVGVSGVVARKTGAALEKFNAVSGRAAHIAELYRQHTSLPATCLADIALGASADTETVRRLLRQHCTPETAQDLITRLDQFIEETAILGQSVAALESGDLSALGKLVDRSHELAADCLLNQVPETNHLQRSARELGAVAASGFGAGFGGAVWAMVGEARAEAFVQAWQQAYTRRFPQRAGGAVFLQTMPGAGAAELAAGST